MMHIFHADKMIARVIREGKGDLLDDKTRELIKSLDGEPANDYNWESMVHGENLGLIAATDKHPETYVNLADCD